MKAKTPHHTMPFSDPRSIALKVLNEVDRKRQTLDGVIEDTFGKSIYLSRKDMALCHALIYGVLRWRKRLDWTIAHFSHIPLSKINPEVFNAIRLGMFQMTFLDRIPVSAAVYTTVELTKSIAGPWVARFVNALLRNAARGLKDLLLPDLKKQPEGAIAIHKSFPEWLVTRWVTRYGLKTTAALCDVINTIPPVTLRINTLLTSRMKLLHDLIQAGEQATPTRFSPEGVQLHRLSRPLFDMTSFSTGCFQVQDEGAQLVTRFMRPRPRETVLDACAGLGGKTGHIGQMMQNTGRIVAMDSRPDKLKRLEMEMARLNITDVSSITHNLDKPLNGGFFNLFDRILVDAPCSGLGVLRRNPDAKWTVTQARIHTHQTRQLRFLDTLVPALKPSGMLIYAVCSLEPEENEWVVKNFLYHHPSFAIVSPQEDVLEDVRVFVDSKGYFRTCPLHHDMDGFFSVRLRRA